MLDATGLLPHLNSGVLSEAELQQLRPHAVSMGMMLESASTGSANAAVLIFARRTSGRRGAGVAARRGRVRIPYTSGLLIGIGETRRERIEALLALRDVHDEHGHLQEIIIQNFRAKPRTAMANAAEPDLDDHLWTIAAARLVFGAQMSIQAPPNLQPDALERPRRAASTTGASPRSDFVIPRRRANLADLAAHVRTVAVAELQLAIAGARIALDRMVDAARLGADAIDARICGGSARGARSPRVVARSVTAAAREPRVADTLARARAGAELSDRRSPRCSQRVAKTEPCSARPMRFDVRRTATASATSSTATSTTRTSHVSPRVRVFEGPRRGAARPGYLIDAMRSPHEPGRPGTAARPSLPAGCIHPQFTGDVPTLSPRSSAPSPRCTCTRSRRSRSRTARERLTRRSSFCNAPRRRACDVARYRGRDSHDEVRRVLCPDKLTRNNGSTSCAAHETVSGRPRRSCSASTRRALGAPPAARPALQVKRTGSPSSCRSRSCHGGAAWRKGLARSGPTLQPRDARRRLAPYPVIPNTKVGSRWARAGRPVSRGRCERSRGTLMNERARARAAGARPGNGRDTHDRAWSHRSLRLAAHDAVRPRRRAPRAPSRRATTLSPLAVGSGARLTDAKPVLGVIAAPVIRRRARAALGAAGYQVILGSRDAQGSRRGRRLARETKTRRRREQTDAACELAP